MLPSLLFSFYWLRHSAAGDTLVAVNAEEPCCFHWDFARIEGLQLTKDDAVVPTRVQLLNQQMECRRLQRHAEALALSPEAGSDQRIDAGAGGGLYQSWVRISKRVDVGDEAIAIQPHEGAMRSCLVGAIPDRKSTRLNSSHRWMS